MTDSRIRLYMTTDQITQALKDFGFPSTLDPEANIAVAAWLSEGGTTWRDWSCRP